MEIRKIVSILLISAVVIISIGCMPLSEHIDYNAEWVMVIESLSNPEERVTIKNSDNSSVATREGNSLRYDNIGGRDIDLTISYTASASCKGALEIRTTIANNEEGWMVRSFEGPYLHNIKAGNDDAFLIPLGTGFRLPIKAIADAPTTNNSVPQPWKWNEEEQIYIWSNGYPSEKCTMQWAALQHKSDVIYFASHDSRFAYKYLNVTFSPSTKEANISFCNMLTCFPGEKAEIAPLVIKKFKGEWYNCADTYRKWFLSQRTITNRPEWIKQSSGMLLTILKQQNDEVIVPYSEIGGLLSDAAEARGLDLIGLFGRGIGGHDRFYPDYRPDPKMGGEKALRKGIAEAKTKGKRVILYTNGQLLDMNDTPQFWPDTGRIISVRQDNGKIWQLTYHKYDSAPARHFGVACQSCTTWRDVMLRLAKDAHNLGADGILYDQLAVLRPTYCYHPDHGHRVPSIVYDADRLENMAYVKREMAKINPEFVVMAEGLADYELNTVDIFHGYCQGSIVPDEDTMRERFDDDGAMQYFTEMFHYTFPENVMTMRMPAPSNSRFSMNYNLAFGFRNEVELRYAADREYLASNKVPTIEDYVNVRRASSEDTVKRIEEAGEPLASIKYYKQAILFQQKHSELIMHGKYLAGNGVKLNASSPYIMANGWMSKCGKKVGILVWNLSDEEVTYDVSYKGYKATSIYAPDKESIMLGDRIDAQSLHLIIFEKR